MVLPRLISYDQSGFVKGRNNIENVLLLNRWLQISLKGEKQVISLSKTYDGVSKFYLMKVLRKIRFPGVFIDIICRIKANN